MEWCPYRLDENSATAHTVRSLVFGYICVGTHNNPYGYGNRVTKFKSVLDLSARIFVEQGAPEQSRDRIYSHLFWVCCWHNSGKWFSDCRIRHPLKRYPRNRAYLDKLPDELRDPSDSPQPEKHSLQHNFILPRTHRMHYSRTPFIWLLDTIRRIFLACLYKLRLDVARPLLFFWHFNMRHSSGCILIWQFKFPQLTGVYQCCLCFLSRLDHL